jgi:hypothetical protein
MPYPSTSLFKNHGEIFVRLPNLFFDPKPTADYVPPATQEGHFVLYSNRNDKKIKTGSKYYKTWCLVNGWQKPSRGAKMSPRIFLNKIFKIKTRTVKPPHNRGKMPKDFWYSVVDEIIKVITE